MTSHHTHVLELLVIAGNQHAHCRTCGQFLTVRDLLETIQMVQRKDRVSKVEWDDTTILGLGPTSQSAITK